MKRVMLYTAEGGFVTSGRVPTFNAPPDVLVWGDRVFRYDSTNDEWIDIYIECFAVALIQED